ncbi:hyalin-like, partial [Saccoglossus kowalevskii]
MTMHIILFLYTDAESPVVICPADIWQNTDVGVSWARVSWGTANATDNSETVTDLYVSHAPGSDFPIGNTESPVVICPADIWQNTDVGVSWASVSWGTVNATDNSGNVTDLYVSHTPGSNFPIGNDESPVMICPADILQNTDDGVSWASVSWGSVNATDNSGNVTDLYPSHAPDSNFPIGNAEIPVVICPADIWQNTDVGVSWARVSWGTANATDNSETVTDLYVSHAPGSDFPIGNTESPVVICPADIWQNTDVGVSWASVSWGTVNATDNSGNVTDLYVSHTPGSNFPIGNAESPVVICPADILQNTDDGVSWASVSWGSVNATDNSGNVTDLYPSHAPDSNFPIGNTESPVVICSADIWQNTDVGVSWASVSWGTANATDNSETVTDLYVSHAPGSNFPIGNAESPVVICPADIWQNTDVGVSWARVSWGTANATDNSETVTDLYVSHAPGSDFPIGNTESPVVICPADIWQNTDVGVSWASVSWGTANATDNSETVTDLYVSHAPGSNFPIGNAESPVVICPADILQNTDDGVSWASVSWGSVNATDNSGNVTDLYPSHAPGSNFPIG